MSCGAGPFRSVFQEGFPLQHQHRSSSSLRNRTAFPRPVGEYQFNHISNYAILLTRLFVAPLRPQLLKLLRAGVRGKDRVFPRCLVTCGPTL